VKLLVLKWGFMWKEQNGSKPQLLSRQLWSLAGVSFPGMCEVKGVGCTIADPQVPSPLGGFLFIHWKSYLVCSVQKPPKDPWDTSIYLIFLVRNKIFVIFKISKWFHIKLFWILIRDLSLKYFRKFEKLKINIISFQICQWKANCLCYHETICLS
jgi:hypothetical protein